MSGDFGSFRFGWDSPSRISGTAVMLQESSELLPGEPMYAPSIPFYPAIAPSSGEEVTKNGQKIWKRTPSRCDLVFYQGDDVVIPLYFRVPSIPNMDMSDQSQWYWTAQIRVRHNYRSTLVTEFVTDSTYAPPNPPEQEVGITKVEMFLPRTDNIYAGVYEWEIYSTSPFTATNFPKPDDVDPEDWPPADAIRTWLYGVCTIVPRTSSTDILPETGYVPPAVDPGPDVVVLTTGGFVVGPNGKVP